MDFTSRFCQGKTVNGVDFETFFGDDWEEKVEMKFSEWALRIFGGKSHSPYRSRVHLTYPSKKRTVNNGKCTFSPTILLLHLRHRILGFPRPRNQRRRLLLPRLLRLRTRLLPPVHLGNRRPDLRHLRNQRLVTRHPDPRRLRDLGNHQRRCWHLRIRHPNHPFLTLRCLQAVLPLKSRMYPVYLQSILSLLQMHSAFVTIQLCSRQRSEFTNSYRK